MNNYNYPPGADTPNAPWNRKEDENEPVKVHVMVSTTLSKSTVIETADYTAESWDEYENDDDGYRHHFGGVEYDFSNCDLSKDYQDCEWSIPDLLGLLEEYLIEDLKRYKGSNKERVIKNQLKSLSGWTVDELEVMEDK